MKGDDRTARLDALHDFFDITLNYVVDLQAMPLDQKTSLRVRSPAIALLVLPVAMRRNTSISRAVSGPALSLAGVATSCSSRARSVSC